MASPTSSPAASSHLLAHRSVPTCWAGLRGGWLCTEAGLSGCGFCLPGPPPRYVLPTGGAGRGPEGPWLPKAPLVAALRTWGQAVAWPWLPESPSHLTLNIPGPLSNVSHLGPTVLQLLVPGGEGQAEATSSLAVPDPLPAALRRGLAGQKLAPSGSSGWGPRPALYPPLICFLGSGPWTPGWAAVVGAQGPASPPALMSNASLASFTNTFRLQTPSSGAFFWGIPIILPRYCIENSKQIV